MPEQKQDTDSHVRLAVSVCSSARILVVSYDVRVRTWARRLRLAGFEVFTTDNGIDALLMAHGYSPDLMIVDHVVDWLDVSYLLARLGGEARTANIPILVLTTSTASDLANACRTLGVTSLVVGAKGPPRARRRERRRQGSPANVPGADGSEDELCTDRLSAFSKSERQETRPVGILPKGSVPPHRSRQARAKGR